MFKTIPLLIKTMQCPINKPQRRLPGPWSWKKLKKWRKFEKKPEKNANFVKKIAKICDIQKLKPIPWQLKIFQ